MFRKSFLICVIATLSLASSCNENSRGYVDSNECIAKNFISETRLVQKAVNRGWAIATLNFFGAPSNCDPHESETACTVAGKITLPEGTRASFIPNCTTYGDWRNPSNMPVAHCVTVDVSFPIDELIEGATRYGIKIAIDANDIDPVNHNFTYPMHMALDKCGNSLGLI